MKKFRIILKELNEVKFNAKEMQRIFEIRQRIKATVVENTVWRRQIVTRRDVFMALCKVYGNGHLHYWQLRMQTISSNIPIPACNAFPAPKCVVACHRWDSSIQPHYWQMTTKITGFLERKKSFFIFQYFLRFWNFKLLIFWHFTSKISRF